MQQLEFFRTKVIKIMVLFFILGFSFVQASGWQKDKLDQYFAQLAKHDKAHLSLSLLKNGEIIYQRTIGKLGTNGPASDNDTIYRIGSISKMYTTTMIMQMVEAGKLSLDTPLSNFFPKVKNSQTITIKHLLGHRSGIHNFTDMPEYPGYMTEEKTSEEILDIIYNMASDYTPGSQASYSNSNYILLGYIIETVDKASYSESLNNRILQPLKLTRTGYGGTIDVRKNQAESMLFQQDEWQTMPETHMSIPHAAGAVTATATEVAQFIEALFKGKLISEASLDAMITIQDGYGLGTFPYPVYDRVGYGHSGGIDGFTSITTHFPEDGFTISVLASATKINLRDVYVAALSAYFNRDFEIPDFNQNTIYLSPDELAVYVGDYETAQLPIDLKIFINDKTLFGQGSGQGAFPLTAVDKHKFVFERAGIEIEFSDKRADGKAIEFTMRQGGGTFPFSRKN